MPARPVLPGSCPHLRIPSVPLPHFTQVALGELVVAFQKQYGQGDQRKLPLLLQQHGLPPLRLQARGQGQGQGSCLGWGHGCCCSSPHHPCASLRLHRHCTSPPPPPPKPSTCSGAAPDWWLDPQQPHLLPPCARLQPAPTAPTARVHRLSRWRSSCKCPCPRQMSCSRARWGPG